MGQRVTDLDLLGADVASRRIDRRTILMRATALSLSAPVIAGLLAACGGDDDDDETPAPAATTGNTAQPTATGPGNAQTTPAATSTIPATSAAVSPTAAAATATTSQGAVSTEEPGKGRGAGELLRLLFWQPPTILNPHLSQGEKDNGATCLVMEPLMSISPEGTLIPVLAAEVPTLENGGIAPDGLSVTYKLRQGVVWSDGEPFTAEDVRFTWEYVITPDAGSSTFASFEPITDVEIVDEYTVTVRFAAPNPNWSEPFTGSFAGPILPKHILQDHIGAGARDAPFNLAPIGTGAYKVTEFSPGDVVLYEINELYRDETRPYFRTVELKGGGDAVTATRAALQTGETDFAWFLYVEKDVLEQISADGDAGELVIQAGAAVEQLRINFADPNTEVDGARAEPSTQHPFLTDLNVRKAFAAGVDKDTIAAELFGPFGSPVPNILLAPPAFVSPNTSYVFDPDLGNSLFDQAGWLRDGDIRKKDGKEMRVVYQTTINAQRQKEQEVIKQTWESMGVPTELKAIDAGVFFSGDAGNPDTEGHFYADFQMWAIAPGGLYPISYMTQWKSTDPAQDLAQKSNGWVGPNRHRWVNEEFNQLYEQAVGELDPTKQAELFIGMNDLVINEVVNIPIVQRKTPHGINKKLRGLSVSSFETITYDVVNWYFEE